MAERGHGRIDRPDRRVERTGDGGLVSSCRASGHEQVEIGLTIDGSRLVMRSCSACDTRSWHRDGEAVALDGVLHDISAVPTRYRRSLSS